MRKSELRNKISFSYLWYFLSFPFAHFPSYFYKNDSIVIKTDLKAFRLNISHIDIYFFLIFGQFLLSMTWSVTIGHKFNSFLLFELPTIVSSHAPPLHQLWSCFSSCLQVYYHNIIFINFVISLS